MGVMISCQCPLVNKLVVVKQISSIYFNGTANKQEVSSSVCYTGFLYFFEMFDLISDK